MSLILSRKSEIKYGQNKVYIKTGEEVLILEILNSNYHGVKLGFEGSREFEIFREENLTSEKRSELEEKAKNGH